MGLDVGNSMVLFVNIECLVSERAQAVCSRPTISYVCVTYVAVNQKLVPCPYIIYMLINLWPCAAMRVIHDDTAAHWGSFLCVNLVTCVSNFVQRWRTGMWCPLVTTTVSTLERVRSGTRSWTGRSLAPSPAPSPAKWARLCHKSPAPWVSLSVCGVYLSVCGVCLSVCLSVGDHTPKQGVWPTHSF